MPKPSKKSTIKTAFKLTKIEITRQLSLQYCIISTTCIYM